MPINAIAPDSNSPHPNTPITTASLTDSWITNTLPIWRGKERMIAKTAKWTTYLTLPAHAAMPCLKKSHVKIRNATRIAVTVHLTTGTKTGARRPDL